MLVFLLDLCIGIAAFCYFLFVISSSFFVCLNSSKHCNYLAVSFRNEACKKCRKLIKDGLLTSALYVCKVHFIGVKKSNTMDKTKKKDSEV